MNKPKRIGTAAETAVVNHLLERGYAQAERLALRGATDHGDIRVNAKAHLEVKAGKAADNASLNQCHAWMQEAAIEGGHAGVDCFLVVKRKGCGSKRVGQWRLFLTVGGLRCETTLDEWLDWWL